MKISVYTGGFVQTNGYLVETSGGNLLIDAPEGIANWAASRGVRIDHVLLTHQHYDHVQDAAALQAGGARLHAFADYSETLTLEAIVRSYGMPVTVTPYRVDERFSIAGGLSLAGLKIDLAHVPGHSTDSVTFYIPSQNVVFSGDTLFAQSIGRTDLPGGGTEQLLSGIAAHLLELPAETKVLPGHGPATTIGRELRENPYLR